MSGGTATAQPHDGHRLVSARRAQTSPARPKDKYLIAATEHAGRCLFCGNPDVAPLEGSGANLGLLFCDRHVRWAMAARRERLGKQARTLRLLLLANCRINGGDATATVEWLRR